MNTWVVENERGRSEERVSDESDQLGWEKKSFRVLYGQISITFYFFIYFLYSIKPILLLWI